MSDAGCASYAALGASLAEAEAGFGTAGVLLTSWEWRFGKGSVYGPVSIPDVIFINKKFRDCIQKCGKQLVPQ
ncbi:hypothetical protein MGYG_00139 [Nannizzia gypsea CBS 118893]|uniref:Uncharacterized protein n=1 Tax=Arthroderma gypseum (strain ATCC MYA-4604 / CBS 118893) TaxID=535722 RepID=E5R367_ARTGP|nr:hypothetical protein MGYG_00139 [Nannizzia gypsea CBS 118893]EFQ97096.1 hypothetical protein MGYG_00139 [Nannizzia gypsea CBS 118893]